MLDEQVKAVVRFKRDAITSREIIFVMPNINSHSQAPGGEDHDRIQLYEEMIRKTKGSFVDGMNYVLMAMYQGFSLTEKIFDVFDSIDGKPFVGLKELVPKPFDTFEFYTDKFGQITKTIQTLDNEEQIIDLDRFIYYVQNPEFDRHYGQSDLREAYRSWYSKDVIIRLYNQFLERFAGGFVVGKPTQGASLVAGTPDYNAMIAAMNNIQNQTSILLPHNIELDIERPATTDQYERAIQLHDLQIAKSLLIPTLLGITPQATNSGGGFAQANTQLEAFLWTLDADASRLEEAMNEQVFEPLNKLNFADGIGPLMKFKAISDTKKMEIVKSWQELVTSGAVEASDTDEHHLRELLEFPHKGEPLKLKPEIGEPTSPPEAKKSVRGPVEDTNTKRVNNAAFSRATKRVSFAVIERKANKIEDNSVIRVESRFGDMVSDMAARIEEEKWGTPAAPVAGITSVDFNAKLKNKARKAIEDALNEAWALGVQHSRTELSSARKQQFKIDMARIDEDAAEFLRTSSVRAFGLLNNDMKAIVQQVLMNGIKFSWTTDQITAKIYDELTAAGFIAAATNSEATGRTIDEIRERIGEALGETHRVRTAVRTNLFEAINEARYSTFTDPGLEGFVEALEYSAILDSRTTRICRHLDDRVYPADDPIWNTYRPPNHFNCRSILVPVTAIDTEVVGKDNESGTRWSRRPTVDTQQGFGS